MEPNEVIETIGSITKLEKLCPLKKSIVENSLVLLNTNPFPGYQVNEKDVEKPVSVFIILKYRYSPEKTNRINKNLVDNRIATCIPSFGEILTSTSILPCIRIKKLSNFSVVPVIQNFFKRHGLQLMEYHPFNEVVRIKIFKTFRLIEIADGVYRDLNDGEKIYIRIPSSINVVNLKNISDKIKSDSLNANFDAAPGIIYRFYGPEDVIRIYDHDKTLRRAIEHKKVFLREIRKEFLVSSKLKSNQ